MQLLNELAIVGIFFLILAVLFLLMTYLVLRKGKSEINIIFSTSTIFFALGSFFCAIDFFVKDGLIEEYGFLFQVGTLGTILYLWAPFGIYLAGKMILHGFDSYKEPIPLIIASVLGIISVVFLVTREAILGGSENPIAPNRGTYFGTAVISFILVLSLYYYYKLYIKAPDLQNQLVFLMGGIGLGIFGLLSALLSSGDIGILPMEISSLFLTLINVGILIAAFSFTGIPQSIHFPKQGTT